MDLRTPNHYWPTSCWGRLKVLVNYELAVRRKIRAAIKAERRLYRHACWLRSIAARANETRFMGTEEQQAATKLLRDHAQAAARLFE